MKENPEIPSVDLQKLKTSVEEKEKLYDGLTKTGFFYLSGQLIKQELAVASGSNFFGIPIPAIFFFENLDCNQRKLWDGIVIRDPGENSGDLD